MNTASGSCSPPNENRVEWGSHSCGRFRRRVGQPPKLGILSDTGSIQDWQCGGVLYMCGVRRDLLYQVQEGSGVAVKAAMPIFETFTPVSNSCSDVPSVPVASSGTTASNGDFPSVDRLGLRSGLCLPANAQGVPQGNCSLTFDQTWFANGYSVSRKRWVFSCRSVVFSPLQ